MTSTDFSTLARQIAPHGALRVAINVSNTLLVTGRDVAGAPTGVAPTLGREIASQLGVAATLVPFATAGNIVDAARYDVWDVALIGDEHSRPDELAFTPPYALIEATYLVPGGSELHTIETVDRSGVRIAAPKRTAYCLWLERNLRAATLIVADGIVAARTVLSEGQADALAGLRPWLVDDQSLFPGGTVLPGYFTAIRQAIGFRPGQPNVAVFLNDFVEKAKSSGAITRLLTTHGASGVTVAA